jgi:hypothetical protein
VTSAFARARLGAVAVTPRPLPAYRDMFLLTDDELPALRARLAGHGVDTEIRSACCSYATTPDSDRMLVCRRRARSTKEPR